MSGAGAAWPRSRISSPTVGRERGRTMRKRLRHWLNEIPIDDPIERRLAILFQIFILFGIIAGVLAVLIQFDALRANNGQGLGVLAPIVGLICYIISLVLLRRG